MDIVARLREACNGHPHAKIPWPHRLLHEAAEEIERLRAPTPITKSPIWDQKFTLTVCRWQGQLRCVYLNDHRIAGSKPWGGAETAAEFEVDGSELLRAVPAIAKATA